MEPLVISNAEELTKTVESEEAPPPKFEEQQLDIIAFKMWRQASTEVSIDTEVLNVEEEICHGS